MRSKGSLRAISMFAVAALILLTAASAWAAGYKVLYNFNSKSSNPSSGLITDAAGNAYGTTSAGGNNDAGTVYELSPKTGYHLLYAFRKNGSGEAGGYLPQGNLVFDSAGNLYGTTIYGGIENSQYPDGGGVVFELTPSANGEPWIETVLYTFCSQANCADGANPQAGVIFDSTGNLYGTTEQGGDFGGSRGTVFELSPAVGGTWIETEVYDMDQGGYNPQCSLLLDDAGNLYGAMGGGSEKGGMVFELSPSVNGWQFSVLYAFDGFNGSTDGQGPESGLVFDPVGNLYGTTVAGGTFSLGTVYQLSPNAGGWTETILHNFGGGSDGEQPATALAVDSAGNVYGTTPFGGNAPCSCGTVFRLAPGSGGEWTETLFRFPKSGASGYRPIAPLFLDSADNEYGTATLGGSIGRGVAFRITQ